MVLAQVDPSVYAAAASWTSPGAAARALPLHARGAVRLAPSEIIGSSQFFAALVQGSLSDPYEVHLVLALGWAADGSRQVESLLEGRCTCPVGQTRCKHLAALLFVVLEQARRQDHFRPSEPPEGPARPGREAGGDSVDGWLAAVEASWATETPTAAAEPTPAERSRIAYVLRAPVDTLERTSCVELAVTICLADRRRKGGARPAGAPLASRRDWQEFACSAPDQRIVRLLSVDYPPAFEWERGSISVHGAERRLAGPALAALVQALAEAGRCTWGDDTRPLSRGPERSAALVWRQRADGQLQLTLSAGDGVLCAGTDSLVYVDVAARLAGPLQTAVPAALIAHAHAAPPLTLAQAEALCASAPDALRPALPKPVALERVVIHPDLVPTLAVQRAGPHGLSGQASFFYGEHQVPVDLPQQSISLPSKDGQALHCFERDGRAERQAIEAAARCGLTIGAAGQTSLPPVPDLQALHRVLEGEMASLQAAGWHVVGLEQIGHPAVAATDAIALTAEDAGQGSLWFQMGMSIDVGGEQHDLVALIRAALALPDSGLHLGDLASPDGKVYLPLPDGRAVSLPASRLSGLLGVLTQLLEGDGSLGLGEAAELLAVCDAGDATWQGESMAFKLMKRLQQTGKLQQLGQARSLRAQLRDYQKDGVTWLHFLRSNHVGGVLADDMGLGKTLQVIALVAYCKQQKLLAGPVLVVAPTGLLANWQAELRKFAPKLTHYIYHGMDRDQGALGTVDVGLTSYGVVARDAAELAAIPFDTVVLDESQQIKNPRSQAHHGVRALQTTHKICLSGTPLQNNLEELWAQFAFCLPALLPDHRSFQRAFRRPIEERQDAVAAARLNARTRPFMLRRTKGEVVAELPAKTEVVQTVALKGRQAELYETVRSMMDKRVREQLAARGLAKSTIAILAALLKLRQVCCDGRLLKLKTVPRGLRSAKLEHLLQLVDTLLAQGRKLLIFSQFTSMLALIAEELTKRDVAYFLLTGKTRDRAGVVAAFQAGERPVFLISLKAGGVGLNLTNADVVIHYDPWWNPAAQQQATDRAHRIGQSRAVLVYKLVVAGSVEEKIMQLQEKKDSLAKQVLTGGALSAQVTQKDIEGLFAPLSAEGK